MTPASELLSEVEARGVAVKRHGEFLELKPKSLLTAELLERIKTCKPQLLVLVKVREALANGRRLSALEIRAKTGLEHRELYEALGELYDWYEVDTDLDGRYWLVKQTVN